ncbi:MAG TPA: ABC transporter substrate-binding protein [Myxococcaceae bacterium]|nr:ABC transporter substrate-binding protein [Myxococcaceae bacterium]
MKRLSLRWSTAVLVLLGAAPSVFAEEEVKIGAIYPLTGAAASSGLEMRNALELAAELINNGAKGLNLPLSGSAGLPNLKGAKIRLVFGDHQSNPQVGATEAERLITQEKVVALIGCYSSNVTATASQVAERYKVPFLTAESSSATLTQRKFKWFFRTTPHDELFVQNFFEFLKALEKKKGIRPKRIALMNENTLWGTETTKLEERLAQEQGYDIVEKVIYPAKSTQLTSEVQRLKAAKPDLLLQSSYLGDAVLSIKSYQELGLLPQAILANDAGFNDSEFLKTLGKAANSILSREVWALDLTSRNPLIKQVNDIFLKRFKSNFNGNTARSFTGLYTLADAINRAASTQPEAIRKALAETNIAADKLIMPWGGIKFDATGQNTLGSGIIVQAQDGKYVTVWPFELASKDVIWPMPAWDKR